VHPAFVKKIVITTIGRALLSAAFIGGEALFLCKDSPPCAKNHDSNQMIVYLISRLLLEKLRSLAPAALENFPYPRYKYVYVFGALAQLVARFNGIEEVGSSNLPCSTRIPSFTAGDFCLMKSV
jgi:hypothetical protein